MICPFCGHEGCKVIDSRVVGEGIRRRRECVECGRRFSTLEQIERRMPQVVKKSGRREPYDRAKLLSGLTVALRKRPVPTDEVDEAQLRLETRIFAEAEKGEISSERIGQLVMSELKVLDRVAFLRFASVYQEVASPEQFLELVSASSSEES